MTASPLRTGSHGIHQGYNSAFLVWHFSKHLEEKKIKRFSNILETFFIIFYVEFSFNHYYYIILCLNIKLQDYVEKLLFSFSLTLANVFF